DHVGSGRLRFVCVAVEDFVLDPADEKFDLAIAVRVGVLDGRHPELERRALRRVAEALIPGGKLYIDGGDPLIEKQLGR
ncbi:MAG: SAM-dependent methyltransferase, partial [Geminicoccaceae bacterium]